MTTTPSIAITDTSVINDSMVTFVTEISPVSDMTMFAWTTSNEKHDDGTASHHNTVPATSSDKTTPFMTTTATATTTVDYTAMIETTTPGVIISTTPIGNYICYT